MAKADQTTTIEAVAPATIADIEAQQAALQIQMEELQKQREMIAKKDYFDLLDIIKEKKIPLASFSVFLAQQVEEMDILIKYPYKNDKQQDKTFIYKKDQKGRNPFKEHIEQKKLTKDQAYAFAKNEEAKKLIDKWLPAA